MTTGFESLDALAQGVQYCIKLREILTFHAVQTWDEGELYQDLDDVLMRIRDQVKAELDEAKAVRDAKDADNRRVELCSALGVGLDTGWADAMCVMRPRLMPEGTEWPRYGTGEQVRIGDTVRIDGFDGEYKVVGFDIDRGGRLRVKCETPGDMVASRFFPEQIARIANSEPKVLDADGTEIRVGDTVYRLGMSTFEPEYNTLTVTDIRTRPGLTPIETKNSHDGYSYGRPEDFTHRAPVPSADGKPLREGDTVWDEDSGDRLIVVAIEDGGHTIACRYADLGDSAIPTHGLWSPCNLTHERPDSWERLEEDADKEACEYFAHMPCGCETSEMLDETVENCNAAKARDLVRRCRALAERERGE